MNARTRRLWPDPIFPLFPRRVRVVAAIACLLTGNARAGDVLTYHNDAASTGVNSTETLLTPANISVATFAKVFSTPVDGQVYAQPLCKSGVTVTGGAHPGVHNLVFVATQHDSLYAIDANSGVIVWETSFLATGLTNATSILPMPSGDTGSGDITPEIGVCGTPVIDAANKVIYVVAKTKQIVSGNTAAPHYVQTIYKIDYTKGNANIAATNIFADTIDNGSGNYTYRTANNTSTIKDPFVFGTGDGAITVNGTSRVYFNAERQMNRPGLTLYNARVYVAFASHGDNGPYHGWVLAFDASTLAIKAALNTTPNGGLGGIWQGGGSLAMDTTGNFYCETGNGTFDGYKAANGTTTGLDASQFPMNANYGDCFLKISLDGTTSQSTQIKNGWGLKIADYFAPFNNQALNVVDADLGSGGCVVLPGTAGSVAHPGLIIGAGKEGKIYLIDRASMGKFNANTDNVVQTQGNLISGSFDTPAFFNGTLFYVGGGDYGKAFTIANGAFSTSAVKTTPDYFGWPGSTPSISANGANNGVVWTIDRALSQLRAYSASDFSTRVWTSAQAPNGRDQLGSAIKFAVPTVSGGQVFVGTSNALVAYGPPQPPTSAPAAPTGLAATALSGIQVNLTWSDNATNEEGCKIEQSTNGTTYTEIATTSVNAQSFLVNNLQTATNYWFRVRAFNSFNTLSYSAYANVATAQTTAQPPALDFANGFANSTGALIYNGSAKIAGARAELTDGGVDESGSIWSQAKQDIRKWTSTFRFQLTNPNADGITFAIQNNTNTATGASGSSLGYETIGNSIALKFDLYPNLSTTGLYTNGAVPGDDGNALDATAFGLNFHSGDTFEVSLVYNGSVLTETITDLVSGSTGTFTYNINIPTTIGAQSAYVGFTGGTGGQTTTQDILSWTFTVTPTDPPAAPSTLTAAPASGTQINLAWTDDANTESGFKIERKIGAGGAWGQIGATGANVTTYFDTALITATDYFYRVRATNGAGDSAWSNEAEGFTPIPPVTATDAHTVVVNSSQVGLAWTDNANNEDGYKIFRKITTASNFGLLVTLPVNSAAYSDTSVSPGVTYDYHIQAYNLAGYSDFTGFTVQSLTRVSIVATDASAQEATADGATFTVSRLGETTGPLDVAFAPATGAGEAAAGVRYTLSPAGTVTIPAGALSATITLTPLADTAVLGTQNATVNVSTSGYYDPGTPTSATAQLLDSFVNLWKVQTFGSLAAAQSPAAADTAAPAGDGIANLLKYALGLAPLTPGNSALLAQSTRNFAGLDYLTLTFVRPRPAPTGISYMVETTSDLGTWNPAVIPPGYPLDNGNGTETFQAHDAQPVGNANVRLIRLRITRP